MQFASQGSRAAAHTFGSVGNVARSRSIHIPSSVRAPSQGLAQKLLSHSRNFLGSFVAQLTKPGLVQKAPNYSRSFHGTVHSTIKQGLSFPVRNALSRPLQSSGYSPRGPNVASRSIAQVGLGTARNFSSGRPLFQNLVENVPVSARAFLEADWDIKMGREQVVVRRKAAKADSSAKKTASRAREIKQVKVETILETAVESASTYEAEMAHYFPTAAVAEVTTYLLVPLAPTPTAKVPLGAFPSSSSAHPLLPLPEIMGLHGDHTSHSLRVSSLFARLDRAKVWEQGVTCSAYSHGPHIGATESACTVLKLEFVGWSKAAVRGIIGESGTGWCVLEEVSTEQTSDIDSDSITSGDFDEYNNTETSSVMMGAGIIDPAQSFVLPTLDFSSSFVASVVPSPQSLSRTSSFGSDFFAPQETDADWVDFGAARSTSSDSICSVSSSGLDSVSFVEPPSTNGFFSYDFVQRHGSDRRNALNETGPRESLFF